MARRILRTGTLTAVLALAVAAPAGAAVNDSNNASDLGAAMSVDPLTGANLAINYPAVYPTGIGDSPLAGFPTHGNTFTVQSTGESELADDPNTSGSTGEDKGVSGSGTPFGDVFDYQVLRLDVNVPQGRNCLGFDFKFLSDEFPEFVGSSFNDTFLAQLDTLGWTFDSSASRINVTGAPNFAVAAGDQIAVNTVGVTGVSETESAGTTYDAGTQILTARTIASTGPHSVYLSTTDLGDGIYDSAAFMDNLRFENIPPAQCEPPFELELTGGKVKCQGSKCNFPVTCNLPVSIGQGCTNTVELFQGQASEGELIKGRADVAKKKAKKIAKGKANVAAGETKKVKLKLTKAGKKIAKKKKSVKGSVSVTNAAGTANDATEVKIKL